MTDHDEVPHGRPPRFADWLTEPMRRNRGTYIKVALAAAMINLFGLVTSLFSMTVYDRVVPNNAFSSLVALSIGLAIVVVFDFVLRVLRAYFADLAGADIDHEIARCADSKRDAHRGRQALEHEIGWRIHALVSLAWTICGEVTFSRRDFFSHHLRCGGIPGKERTHQIALVGALFQRFAFPLTWPYELAPEKLQKTITDFHFVLITQGGHSGAPLELDMPHYFRVCRA